MAFFVHLLNGFCPFCRASLARTLSLRPVYPSETDRLDTPIGQFPLVFFLGLDEVNFSEYSGAIGVGEFANFRN